MFKLFLISHLYLSQEQDAVIAVVSSAETQAEGGKTSEAAEKGHQPLGHPAAIVAPRRPGCNLPLIKEGRIL